MIPTRSCGCRSGCSLSSAARPNGRRCSTTRSRRSGAASTARGSRRRRKASSSQGAGRRRRRSRIDRGRAGRGRTASRPAEALTLETALAGLLDKKLDWDGQREALEADPRGGSHRRGHQGAREAGRGQSEGRGRADHPRQRLPEEMRGGPARPRVRALGDEGRPGLRPRSGAQSGALGVAVHEGGRALVLARGFWQGGRGHQALRDARLPAGAAEPAVGALPRPTTSSGTCISRPASAIRRSPPGSAACASSPTATSSSSSSGARGSSGAPGQARTAGFKPASFGPRWW